MTTGCQESSLMPHLKAGPDWDAISGREISHSSRLHREKKRGQNFTFWGTKAYQWSSTLKRQFLYLFYPNRY